jgi:hypothetical protein
MNFIAQHPYALIAGYYIFSAAVGAMPEPKDTSSDAYVWLYGFLHIISGNIAKAVNAKYPQLPQGTTQVTGKEKPTP